MSTGAIIGIVVAVVIVLALVALVMRSRMRSRHLQEKFGPEYEKNLQDGQDRRAVERDLAAREKRHAELDIKPLPAETRDRYAQQWALVQEQFVDDPATAVAEADRLVNTVMAERGYPTEGFEQQAEHLSVEHARTLDHYRSAHDIKTRHDSDQVSTEELREAMVHYRALFEDLLGSGVDRRERAAEQPVDGAQVRTDNHRRDHPVEQ